MAQTINHYPAFINGVNDARQFAVLVLAVQRQDDEGNEVTLAPSQAEAALANAKATLELITGTSVSGTVSTLINHSEELAEGEQLTLAIDTSLIKTGPGEEE